MEIKQSKDVCIDKLTSTHGADLEIMANITSSSQIAAVMQGYIGEALNSTYRVNRCEKLLRLTVSNRARGRDDLAGIGKVADIQGWQGSPAPGEVRP